MNSMKSKSHGMTSWAKNARLLVLLLPAIGCGGGPPVLDLVPVSGTVKLGGEPAKRIVVTFVPIGSTPGIGATTIAGDDGTYEVTYDNRVKKMPGLPPGQYVVYFADSSLQELRPAEATKKMLEGGGLQIPDSWKVPSLAGEHNKVTVSEVGGTIDFGIPLAGKEASKVSGAKGKKGY